MARSNETKSDTKVDLNGDWHRFIDRHPQRDGALVGCHPIGTIEIDGTEGALVNINGRMHKVTRTSIQMLHGARVYSHIRKAEFQAQLAARDGIMYPQFDADMTAMAKVIGQGDVNKGIKTALREAVRKDPQIYQQYLLCKTQGA